MEKKDSAVYGTVYSAVYRVAFRVGLVLQILSVLLSLYSKILCRSSTRNQMSRAVTPTRSEELQGKTGIGGIQD